MASSTLEFAGVTSSANRRRKLSPMAMISLKDVTKIYHEGDHPALSHINLDVDRGEFVFLVGASGSGKTTLLQLLLREQEATEGEIHVAGNDLRRMPDRLIPRYRRQIGFVFQDYKLLVGKTVWENVAFALQVIGARRSTIRTLVPQVLTTVGLTGKENSFPHELSGGEAQRVAIARAYVNHPQILLADEPTGNLDPTTSIGIMEVLNNINRTGGTTIIMATHNEEIVNAMHKRVVELNKGVLVRDEKNGMYDSSLYYPDQAVQSRAESAAHQQSERVHVVKPVSSAPSQSAEAQPKSQRQTAIKENQSAVIAERTAQMKEDEEVVEASGGDPGIARLARTIHSGKSGRYQKAFQPVEDTLTWGKGLHIPAAQPLSGIIKESRQADSQADRQATSGQANHDHAPDGHIAEDHSADDHGAEGHAAAHEVKEDRR
jgi:cell division transport system ATP-binding protein